nr:MAG: hypothetical protein H1Bulk29607_000004 [Cystoviridae sp.]
MMVRGAGAISTAVELDGLADTMTDIYVASLAELGIVLFPQNMLADIPLGKFIATRESIMYAIADKVLSDGLTISKGSSGSPMGSPMGATAGTIPYSRVVDGIRQTVNSIGETMSKVQRILLRYGRTRGYANAAFTTGIPNSAMYDIISKLTPIANFHLVRDEPPIAPNETISELIQMEVDDVLSTIRSAPLLKEHPASAFIQMYTRERVKAKRTETDALVYIRRNIATTAESPPTQASHMTFNGVTTIRAIPDDMGYTKRMVDDLSNVGGGTGFRALEALRETDMERAVLTDIPRDEMVTLAMCLSNMIHYTDNGQRRFFEFTAMRPFPNEIATSTRGPNATAVPSTSVRGLGTSTMTTETVEDVLMLTADVPSTTSIPVSSGLIAFVAQNKDRLSIIGETDGSWRDADEAWVIEARVISPAGRNRIGPTPSDPSAVKDFNDAIANGDAKSMAGTAILVEAVEGQNASAGGPPPVGGKAWTLKAVQSVTTALDLTFAMTKIGIPRNTREQINQRTWPFGISLKLLTAQESSKTKLEGAKYVASRYIHVPVAKPPTKDEALAVAQVENSNDPTPLTPAQLDAIATRYIDTARTDRVVHWLPMDKLGTEEERGIALSLVTASLLSYYIPLITSPTIRRMVANIFAYVRFPFMEPEGIEEVTNYINVAHAVLRALSKGLGFSNGYHAMLSAVHNDIDTMRAVVQSLATTRSGGRFGS